MAQRVEVKLVDDLDGSEATDSITFGFEGIEYAIDLNTKNAEAFRKAIAPYLGAATRVGKGRKSSAGAAKKSNAKEVREWGIQNGYDVPARGRIPAEVQQAFDAVN